jgi:hypothetical protein
VVRTTRLMARLRPMPIASLATSTSHLRGSRSHLRFWDHGGAALGVGFLGFGPRFLRVPKALRDPKVGLCSPAPACYVSRHVSRARGHIPE